MVIAGNPRLPVYCINDRRSFFEHSLPRICQTDPENYNNPVNGFAGETTTRR